MKKLNYLRFKIRPTILIVFLVVVGIAVLSTIGLQYYYSKQMANDTIINGVKELSEKTEKKLLYFDNSSADLISLLELSHGIDDLSNKKNRFSIIKKITTAIKTKNFIYAIYVGLDNGDFYEVINLENNNNLREIFGAKSDERWLGIKITNKNGKRIETKSFLNRQLKLQRELIINTSYNPTVRPWYIKASRGEDVIKTKPYMFANLKSNGVTYAKQLSNTNAVIGVDISLENLSYFLDKQVTVKGSHFYLFDEEGKVIVSNKTKDKLKSNLNGLLKSSIKKRLEVVTIQDKKYFVSSQAIDSLYAHDEYLSIFINKHEVMKPYHEKIINAVLINILLMVIILPLIWYSTKLIVNPIIKLEEENNKIKNREYDKVESVPTSIKEIHNLSESLIDMAHSIKHYQESQIKLMDSFIELIASAIDAKSEYTGGHCNRVPILTLMLTQAASDKSDGVLKEFRLETEEEKRELSIAAWLHDCGKITTPEYVVDKATKLETIYNRIHEVRTRFEVVYRDLIIESYKKIQDGEDKSIVDTWLEEEQQKLILDFEFIAKSNIGAEFLKDEDKEKIIDISKRTWIRFFDDSLGISNDEKERYPKSNTNIENILSDKQSHIIKRKNFDEESYKQQGFKQEVPKNLYNLGEVYNMSISRGTLTKEERFKINEHIIMSIKMLDRLPFPDHLKHVPEYAGAHHETLIGTGYPKKLKKEDMSIPARIMAIADVFEALTASDRPYKDMKNLSESIKILSFMVKDKHIDEDLFKLFLESGVYLDYARQYLKSEQIDEVDISKYI